MPRSIVVVLLLAGVVGGMESSDSLPSDPPEPIARREGGQTNALSGAGGLSTPVDPYSWMRDDLRSRRDVLDYIQSENAYATAYLSRLEPLADALADEMDAIVPSVEWRAPRTTGAWQYAERRGPGDGHWDVYRRPHAAASSAAADDAAAPVSGRAAAPAGDGKAAAGSRDSGGWQLVGPFNALARGHRYFDVPRWAPSPDGRWLAFAVDARGDEEFSVYVLPMGAAAKGGSSPAGSPGSSGGSDSGGSAEGEAAASSLLVARGVAGGGALVWSSTTGPESRGTSSSSSSGNGSGGSGSSVLFVLEQPGAHERQGGGEARVVRHAVGPHLAPGLQLRSSSSSRGSSTDGSSSDSERSSSRKEGSGSNRSSSPERRSSEENDSSEEEDSSRKEEGSSSAKTGSDGAVLLVLEEGALDVELSASSGGEFLMLKFSGEDGNGVLALPMAAAVSEGGIAGTHTSSSDSDSDSSSNRSRGTEGVRAAVPGWRWVLAPSEGRDCLQADHWRGDTFVLLVDDWQSPDGRVELVTVPPAASPAAGASPAASPVALPGRFKRQLLAGNWEEDEEEESRSLGGSSSRGSIDSKDSRSGDKNSRGGFSDACEVNGFALTPTHAAVLLRRGGVCVVQAFELGPAAAAAPELSPPLSNQQGSSGDAPDSRGGGSSSDKGTLALVEPPQPSWELSFAEDATAVVSLEGPCDSGSSNSGSVGSGGGDGGNGGNSKTPAAASTAVRLSVQSMVRPLQLYSLDLVSKHKALIYNERMAEGFEPGRYQSALEWAKSHDGVQVPMTVAWRKDKLRRNGSNPAILWGYGAYGSKQFPSFNPADVALLDRGFVLAVAHPRGGSELGAAWHSAGQRSRKPNTFEDLLACARHLCTARFTSPHRLALWGRSAGGLAVAAALNIDPAAAGAAVLDVPFLDVLRTMLDPSLLLTVKERPEWGDPLADKGAFADILSYSPYDNLRPGAPYPAMLVTASLWDRRVCYWEPLKYVAKLRYLKRQQQQHNASSEAKPQQSNSSSGSGSGSSKPQPQSSSARSVPRPLLLEVDMAAGHFAASSAGERLRQRAEKVAFIMTAMGLAV